MSRSAEFGFIAERQDRLQPFLRAIWPSAGAVLWTADPNDAVRVSAADQPNLRAALAGVPLQFRKVMSR